MSCSCLLSYVPSSGWKQRESSEGFSSRYRLFAGKRSSYLAPMIFPNEILNHQQPDCTSRPSDVRRLSSKRVIINREREAKICFDRDRLHNNLSAFLQTPNKNLDSNIHGSDKENRKQLFPSTYNFCEHGEMCKDFSMKILYILETTNTKDDSLDHVKPAEGTKIEHQSHNENTLDYVDAIPYQHDNQGLIISPCKDDIQSVAQFDTAQPITLLKRDMLSIEDTDIEESDFSDAEESEFSDVEEFDLLTDSSSEEMALNEVRKEYKSRTVITAAPQQHTFKSAGSRSSPSRSSVPGRRSKYSKPDHRAIRNKSVASNLRSGEEMLTGHANTERESFFEDISLLLSNSNLDSSVNILSESNQDGKNDDATLTSFPGNKYNLTTSDDIDEHFSVSDTQVLTAKELDMDDLSSSVQEFSDEDDKIYEPVAKTEAHDKVNLQLENNVGLFNTTWDNSDKAVSWNHHPLCDLPFEIQFSYSETPNAPIIGFREQCSPFGPATMQRPWTGGPPIKRRRHFEAATDPTLKGKKEFQCAPEKPRKSREETLGKPLTQQEIIKLLRKCHQENRQVNLGRDGLTHNMLHLIHTHWKRRPVCKIKCRGVPTVDMDNLYFHIEDKTGGKIIYQAGGVLYVFRGRNYEYEERPRIPLMLWKPASPLYPKLVPQAPPGLTKEEGKIMRELGQKVEPLCKLRKNAVFSSLVKDLRDAFVADDLVSLDYEGLNSKDYKKIAAKLRDTVPCVILSFRNNRILLWKGRDSRKESACVETCGNFHNGVTTHMCSEELPDRVKSLSVQSQSLQHDTNDEYQIVQESIIRSESPDTTKKTLECLLQISGGGRGDSTEPYHGQGSDARLEEKCVPTVPTQCIQSFDRLCSLSNLIDIDLLWKSALDCGMALELPSTRFDADALLEKVNILETGILAISEKPETASKLLKVHTAKAQYPHFK